MDEWVLWLTIVIGSFLALEIPALRSAQQGDTLSEHVWKWLKVRDPRSLANDRLRSMRIAVRGLLVLFLAWLAGHLAMGWWVL